MHKKALFCWDSVRQIRSQKTVLEGLMDLQEKLNILGDATKYDNGDVISKW